MKKSTLLAALAAVALSASAQYSVTPGIEDFMKRVDPCEVTPLVLGETLTAQLEKAGFTINPGLTLNDQTINWYWWAGWTNGDGSLPDPDFSPDGYISQVVTGADGWSGGGTNVGADAHSKIHFTDESVLHITLSSANQPASLGFIFLDAGEIGGAPAKLAFGKAAFDDNGVIYPLVGNLPEDGDWAAFELKFSDIKKLWPGFINVESNDWHGNAFIFLSGNVAGTGFNVCQSFVYTPAGAGVSAVAADQNNAPVEFFNLQGIRVANPENGLFIRRQGSQIEKVIL